MSNALGRLVGTLLSGWVFQAYGLGACLWISTVFVLLAALISIALPRHAAGVLQANEEKR
jgi:predicted MFS family arabinose efflux permease